MPVVSVRLASDRRQPSRGRRERSQPSLPPTASVPPRSAQSCGGQTGDPDRIGALGQPDHDNHLVALRSLWKTGDEYRRQCSAASTESLEPRVDRAQGHSGTLAQASALRPDRQQPAGNAGEAALAEGHPAPANAAKRPQRAASRFSTERDRDRALGRAAFGLGRGPQPATDSRTRSGMSKFA